MKNAGSMPTVHELGLKMCMFMGALCPLCREPVTPSYGSGRTSNRTGCCKGRGALGMDQNAYRLAATGPSTYTKVCYTVVHNMLFITHLHPQAAVL